MEETLRSKTRVLKRDVSRSVDLVRNVLMERRGPLRREGKEGKG